MTPFLTAVTEALTFELVNDDQDWLTKDRRKKSIFDEILKSAPAGTLPSNPMFSTADGSKTLQCELGHLKDIKE